MLETIRKVFIVDDSKIFRFTVVKLFGFSGFDGEISEFESGQSLIEYLIENKNQAELLPDLILLDINMPNLSGFDCLEELKKLGEPFSNLKVKMLSSSIDKDDMDRAAAFRQVEGFISKPLNHSIVKNLIGRVEEAA